MHHTTTATAFALRKQAAPLASLHAVVQCADAVATTSATMVAAAAAMAAAAAALEAAAPVACCRQQELGVPPLAAVMVAQLGAPPLAAVMVALRTPSSAFVPMVRAPARAPRTHPQRPSHIDSRSCALIVAVLAVAVLTMAAPHDVLTMTVRTGAPSVGDSTKECCCRQQLPELARAGDSQQSALLPCPGTGTVAFLAFAQYARGTFSRTAVLDAANEFRCPAS